MLYKKFYQGELKNGKNKESGYNRKIRPPIR
jgi:hypothetical protein